MTKTTPSVALQTISKQDVFVDLFSDVMKIMIFGVVFMVLGWQGFASALHPVVASIDFSVSLLVAWSVAMVVMIIQGTWFTAKSGELLGTEWSSMWTPLRVALTASCFVPCWASMSAASLWASWCLSLGASWVA